MVTRPGYLGRAATVLLAALLGVTALVIVGPRSAHATTKQENMALLAFANVGKTACGLNSKKTTGFYSSCHGSDNGPEYWCADFVKWIWAQNGATGTGALNAAAYSFYTYGLNHGGVHATPKVGDVAIFAYSKGDKTNDGGGIHHVAVVTGWSDSGKLVHTISGDWYDNPPPSSTSENDFARGSKVVENNKGNDYASAPGSRPSGMTGLYVIGYVSPVL